MSYLALYRKWRPKLFEDVVGQDHLINTLKNQIENDNFGHAYLFTGIRGTGKTSTAKIFSRAINCLNPQGHNPCNRCDVCTSILNDSSMDIIEIDAASNNSVDDIRELRENVKFPPSKADYKVYIIDEVHMLSKGAFNALLKTLEEPPAYVVFILATTEPNKIPDTILSRCQRYDLKRVSNEDIRQRLIYILEQMTIGYDQSALDLIVSKAEGSVRDALSILDQCLSYHHDKLDYDYVIDILGLVEVEFLNDLLESIINDQTNEAIQLIDNLISQGKDISQFIDSLIIYFRNVMLFKLHSDPSDLISASEEAIGHMKTLSDQVKLNKLTRAINIFTTLEKDLRFSSHDRVLLEISLIKIFNPIYDTSNEALIERIEILENKIKALKYAPAPVESTHETQNETSNSSTKMEEKKVPKQEMSEEKSKSEEKIEKADEIIEFVDASSQQEITLDDLMNEWSEFLSILKRVRIKVYAFIIESTPIAIKDQTIILKFEEDYQFHAENLMKSKNKETVEEILKKVYAMDLSIDVTFEAEAVQKKTKTEKKISNDDVIAQYFIDFDKKLEIED